MENILPEHMKIIQHNIKTLGEDTDILKSNIIHL